MITIVDFYADWCGPCQSQKPILEKFASDNPDKVSLEKINVDENQERAQEFGVMSIPTLLLMKDGKEVERRTGLQSEELLKQWVESHS